MEDPVCVEVVYCGGELEDECFYLGGGEGFAHVFLEGLEIVLDEVHDEVDGW